MTADDNAAWTVRRLAAGDVALFRRMLALFGEAFEQPDVYRGAPPADAYVERLLSGDQLIALVAFDGARVIGALAAYDLPKFEQERGEIYIYDLAVAATHRRRGVATALITALKPMARARGAHGIFVQADRADAPAAALYDTLGARAEVLHFDIPLAPAPAESGPQNEG